jgi:anthranilate/para-aminobenzoate synthase component I
LPGSSSSPSPPRWPSPPRCVTRPQPSNDPAWITASSDEATYFGIVQQHTGNDGLIAHNYLAGAAFYELQEGDIAQLILGDGTVIEFEINSIQQYRALSPNSPTSNFVSLESGETLTASDLFFRVYGGQVTLTFQTCLNRNNISTWGRTFIIGTEL